MSRYAWLCSLILLSTLLHTGVCIPIRFTLSTTQRCVSEDLDENEVGECSYTIVPAEDASQVTVRAVDPFGQNIWMQSPNDRAKGSFKIDGGKPGEYQVCFTNRGQSEKTVTLDFEVGGGDNVLDSAATKEDMLPIERQLSKLVSRLRMVHQDITDLSRLQDEDHEADQAIASRVWWFSIVTIVILVSLSAFQISYLRRFFQKKKMI